jgi:putative glutamine amidotransferase
MGRPIIGITGELEAARWGNWIREAVVSPVSYTRAVERAGGVPVVLPPVPVQAVPGLIAALDAIVFTDGRDLDPGLYDEQPHEQNDPPDFRRDRFELALIRAAIDEDLPFLAIDRGMHLLNVARGGTITQHLPGRLGNETHRPDPVKLTMHEIQLSAASKTGRALSASAAKVSAGHRQGINRIGSGLLTVAWTPDQVVEGVELQGHAFGIGVQWHPEEADDLGLFEALVSAAADAVLASAAAAADSGKPSTSAAASDSASASDSAAADSVSRKRDRGGKRAHARRLPPQLNHLGAASTLSMRHRCRMCSDAAVRRRPRPGSLLGSLPGRGPDRPRRAVLCPVDGGVPSVPKVHVPQSGRCWVGGRRMAADNVREYRFVWVYPSNTTVKSSRSGKATRYPALGGCCIFGFA